LRRQAASSTAAAPASTPTKAASPSTPSSAATVSTVVCEAARARDCFRSGCAALARGCAPMPTPATGLSRNARAESVTSVERPRVT
jgi:hypothetical protein